MAEKQENGGFLPLFDGFLQFFGNFETFLSSFLQLISGLELQLSCFISTKTAVFYSWISLRRSGKKKNETAKTRTETHPPD